MCRSIIRLREGDEVFDEPAMDEAALQYVRKVSGFRKPSAANQEAFDRAVSEISAATQRLMDALVIGARS